MSAQHHFDVDIGSDRIFLGQGLRYIQIQGSCTSYFDLHRVLGRTLPQRPWVLLLRFFSFHTSNVKGVGKRSRQSSYLWKHHGHEGHGVKMCEVLNSESNPLQHQKLRGKESIANRFTAKVHGTMSTKHNDFPSLILVLDFWIKLNTIIINITKYSSPWRAFTKMVSACYRKEPRLVRLLR